MSVLLIRCIYDIYVKLPEKFSFLVNLGNETSHIRCLNENGASIFSYKEKDSSVAGSLARVLSSSVAGSLARVPGTLVR